MPYSSLLPPMRWYQSSKRWHDGDGSACSGMGGPTAFFRARKRIKAFTPNLVMTWLHHSDLFGVLLRMVMPSLPLVWNIRCSKLSLAELPWRNLLIVRLLAWLSWAPTTIVANSVAESGSTSPSVTEPGMAHIAERLRYRAFHSQPRGRDQDTKGVGNFVGWIRHRPGRALSSNEGLRSVRRGSRQIGRGFTRSISCWSVLTWMRPTRS